MYPYRRCFAVCCLFDWGIGGREKRWWEKNGGGRGNLGTKLYFWEGVGIGKKWEKKFDMNKLFFSFCFTLHLCLLSVNGWAQAHFCFLFFYLS